MGVFDDYKQKDSVVVVYTGEGKGKTSASLGLMARALGNGWRVAYVQFIKHWEVGEHKFLRDISDIYKNKLVFYKGGAGFYKAGSLSAKNISDKTHRDLAKKTYQRALKYASSGKFDLLVCDEINNAIHDGLLEMALLEHLINSRHQKTSLCLTGRNFPEKLIDLTDIATNMTKVKHHFDDKYLANKGIDY
ncbi:hypothetical protein DYH10_03050 [Candidatus Saccharibacteria bacterium CPR2]|nr:hypothetical protein [Candidatus Saccharibacteria bacterium CPR2]